ncbi:TatD family hydrolase [Jeongeupia naejangsanensis]|uniref:TatD family hydrolase n=1 Tax=Jeongeupia naejangsanensis TaxID=613195 RepID=A0ABS2BM17_9NEIS|nr:TatD family hydrolase [Jeongeupia naejangsanensis]MBM3116655.1 TatD family hydrolase [Jeongeupia naejangsanensis]
MLIDSHCHLDAPEFDADRDRVVAAAIAAGVGQLVVPSVGAAMFDATRQMRERYGCAVAYGLHPIYVAEHRDEHLQALSDRLTREPAVAVGEIGLDFYVPGLDAARQVALFEAQLRIAREADLPVIVHIRRSQDQVLKYLRKWRVRGGIAHAFNGSAQQAEAFLKLGFKLGFGGAMTYSGSQRIRRLAAELPLDGIVLETDAPDIAPAWLAGPPPGRNAPDQLPSIAAVLAELRGLDVDTVQHVCMTNTEAVLGPLGRLQAGQPG